MPSGSASWNWFLIYEYEPLCPFFNRGMRPSDYLFILIILVQAADQFLEFLRNFYRVFPEFQRMDVSISHSSFDRVLPALDVLGR